MSELNKSIILYHANCADGFGSAWLFELDRAAKQSNTQRIYKEVQYGMKNFSDILALCNFYDNVYILDFSFTKDQIISICSEVYPGQVTLLDHHETAVKNLNWYNSIWPENYYQKINNNYSGVGQVADYFGIDLEDYPLARYIQDRDLWRFMLPCSKEINAVIGATEKTFETYSGLNANLLNNFEEVVFAGGYLLAQQKLHVNSVVEMARVCLISTPTGTYKGLICNCPGFYSSEVGNELAKISGTFGATFQFLKDGKTQVSLRSIGDFNVASIAAAFGGGGHKNAAGFVMTEPQTTDTVTFFTGVPNE